MRVATILLAVTIGAGSALAEWQAASETSPAGKPIAMQRTPAKGTFPKSGREVSATLYVRCDNPYPDRNKYRSNDFWSVFVLFSEPVSSVDARTRYNFDGGKAEEATFMFNQRGTAMFFTQQGENDEFINKLARSNTLEVTPTLAWAGSPTIVFDIAGATAALQQIPCNKKF